MTLRFVAIFVLANIVMGVLTRRRERRERWLRHASAMREAAEMCRIAGWVPLRFDYLRDDPELELAHADGRRFTIRISR